MLRFIKVKTLRTPSCIKPSILEFQKDFLTNILLFGSNKFEEIVDRVLQSTITYFKFFSRFESLQIDQDITA